MSANYAQSYTSKNPQLAATYARALGVSVDDLDKLLVAAYNTWQYIGYDVIAANDGRDVPRAAVIDAVHDFILSNDFKLPMMVQALLANFQLARKLDSALNHFVFTQARYGL